VDKAWAFAVDPKNLEKYTSFQSALHAANMVASLEVSHLLENRSKGGLAAVETGLRFSDTPREMIHIQTHQWYVAMEAVMSAMQNDVRQLARPKGLVHKWIRRSGMPAATVKKPKS
jgi:hypothetical protein